jgi:glycosyltransferase involved in cell wall biosynthesis
MPLPHPAKGHIVISATSDIATDQRIIRASKTLFAEGYKVTVVGRLLNNSLPVKIEGVSVVRKKLVFNNGPLFYAFYNIRLFFYLLFHKYDILLANDLDTLPANYIASKIKKCKLVYDSHEYFTGVPEIQNRKIVKSIWEAIEKYCVPKTSAMYTVNESIANLYRKKYGREVSVVRNVPDIIDPVIFQSHETKVVQRKKLGLPITKSIVVMQGAGINIDRGAEEAVEAMRYLKGVVLLVIGGGDVLHLLKNLVQKYALNGCVIFYDKMPYEKLLQYTSASDIGLTLDKDTNINYKYSLPNKLFDYINSGIPVLATQLPEVQKIIDKYEIGMFVNNHNPEHIADKIKEMLTLEERIDKWKNNLVIASQELNWKKESAVLLNIFKNLD